MHLHLGSTALFLLVLLTASPAVAAPDAPAPPVFPKHGAKTADFIPRDRVILGEAKGDLNGDDQDDHVLVLGTQPNQTDSAGPPRQLLVLLADKSAGLTLAASSSTAILGRFDGGILGDPFQGVTIERGTFLITHLGGSRQRWEWRHRFRLQHKKWSLIGRTKTTHDTLTGTQHQVDENLNTGNVIETARDSDGKQTRTNRRQKAAPVLLSTIQRGDTLTHLMRHTC